MRIRFALAVTVVLTACGGTEADNPRLEIGAGGFTLHLPDAMQASLVALAPGFQQVRSAAFRSDIAQSAAESGGGGMAAMFAVIGDFDGDGSLDVAIEGSAQGDTGLVVIAILNKGGKPQAMQVTRFPTYDGDAVGIYLSKPKGAGAFTVVNYPDASATYRFSGGKFVAQ
jgi:hypothetical protein